MPDYELHADFDRNGRMNATAAEHGLRGTPPGAILVPNLDADGRRLPTTVTLGSRVTLDRDQPVVLAGDDEALPLRIVVHQASAPAGTRFFLRPVGFARIRVRLHDATGRILPWDTSRPTDIPVAVPAVPGSLNLTLTTKTLPGSPIGRVTDTDVRFALDGEDESGFLIQLVSLDPAGVEAIQDEARFTVAPFVILDNASVALRAYVCDLPDNQASVLELDEALGALGVPLLRVPPEVANGDTWLQDQFQHALIQGADGWRQVVLHLPRLRSDSSNGTSAGNLATFVTSHFPSRDVGVFDDFWARELQFLDASGTPRQIGFRECDRLAVMMFQPITLARLLIDHIKRIDSRFDPEWPHTGPGDRTTWGDVRGWLPELVQQFRRRARAAGEAGNAEWQATLERMAGDAQARVDQVASRLPFDPDRGLAGLPTRSGQIEVTASEAHRVFQRVLQMHHSSNYGGNIEASPPTPDAQLGKLVIGNAVVDGERDFMDPDLLRLLFKQRKQPVVQLDSTWLDVGHVDEFMAFAPDRRGSGAGFAVLRASSGLALKLVEEAERRYLQGLPIEHPHRIVRRPSGVLARLTDGGTAPVTRLFRGKVWQHRHARATGDEIPQVLEPPRIYQDLSQAMNGGDPTDPDSGGINVHGIRYWPGEGPDRTYPADISVREVLYGETDFDDQSTNALIERQFLADATRRLSEAFPQARLFPLPVLFDRVSSVREWEVAPSAYSTSAFTPDVVNLQAINGRLLIPRPYGPRMLLPDAIAAITAATAEFDLPTTVLGRLDERFVRRHRLRTGVYWVQRQPPVYRTVSGIGTVRSLYEGLETEDDVIEQFRDSFPGATARQLRRQIIEPNRRHFDARGRLRDGWRRLELTESMVDIFETYIHAIAAELDVPISWIDSWYYHVHAGGIHCGTNVLRTPGRGSSLPAVWRVPDLQYEAAPIEFEEEDVITVPGRG